MMKVFVILFFSLLYVIYAYPQCNYRDGDKLYSSTCFESLSIDENTCIQDGCELSFVKNGTSGFAIIKAHDPNPYFTNKVFIYLEDSKIITLIPTSKQWVVNNTLYGQFNLTEKEINMLKKSNIIAIRYWTCIDKIDYNSFCKNASEFYNPPCEDFLSGIISTTLGEKVERQQPKRIDFNGSIKQLFENY